MKKANVNFLLNFIYKTGTVLIDLLFAIASFKELWLKDVLILEDFFNLLLLTSGISNRQWLQNQKLRRLLR